MSLCEGEGAYASSENVVSSQNTGRGGGHLGTSGRNFSIPENQKAMFINKIGKKNDMWIE